jgi:glycine betaine/proline transport system substrate-binding protein
VKAASKKPLVVNLALVMCALAAGCGGSSQNKELVLGNVGWDENVAVSSLTKALLKDDLGYDNVQLKRSDKVGDLFQGVGTGDMDAFQDVWIPNHKAYLSEVRDQVEQLGSWYQGTTRFSIATPSYMGLTSIDQLNDTDVTEVLGIEPDAVIMDRISDDVIPEYGLKQDLVQSSTAGMLSEVDKLYNGKEDFAFVAWSPHWMNQRYDFDYLEDPKGALGDLTQPARLSTIVNNGLQGKDPVAYAFLKALTLTQEQVDDLEDTINKAGDPLQGARQWARENPNVVRPWIDAAKNARQAWAKLAD